MIGMGTRGLVGFRVKGKDYTTYNNSDSYPSGVGADVLDELKKVKNWKKVKALVGALRLVNEDSPPTPEDIKRFMKLFNGKVNRASVTKWYSLLDQLQGTLEPYLNGRVDVMIDSSEFIRDSLFCEWAYIVNLDTGLLEVWKGLQRTPWKRNRYGAKKDADDKRYHHYYPCKRVRVFDLSHLPSKKEFLTVDKDEDN